MDEPLTSQDIEHSPNDLSSCASRTELGAERPKVTTCHFDISEGELQWPARMLDEFEEEFFPRDFNSETRRNSCGPKVWPRAEIGHGRAKAPIDELARPQSSGEWDGGATSSRGRSFHPGSDVSPHRPELSWDPLKWIALHAAHTIHTTHRALPWGLVILFIFCVSGAMAESIPEETKVNTKGHVLVSIAELLRTHYAISTGFVLFLAALALTGYMFPGSTNTLRTPPAWGPEQEQTYPFRQWFCDVMLWSIATELEPARKAAAVMLNLRGAAREVSRQIPPQAIVDGRC